jgi:serine/threonine-protein kinase
MALEPYLRRRWPQCLILWTRLLSGDLKDPLVAGHILLGTALAVGVALLQNIGRLVAWQINATLPLVGNTISILSAVRLVGLILAGIIIPAAIVMGFFFLLLMLRLIVRKTWIASILFVALLTTSGLGGGGGPMDAAIQFIYACSVLWVMLRFGLLPATMIILVSTIAGSLALTSDFSASYASTGLMAHALVLALAVWSFRNALGGRKVLKEDLLDA